MARYELSEGLYVWPTPGGAYHAVSASDSKPARRLLYRLLSGARSPSLSLADLCDWTGEGEEASLELLYHMQSMAWLQGEEQPREAPEGQLAELGPRLAALADTGKVLLADDQGFSLASHGYYLETAEELSAVAAGLASLHVRHAPLLRNNMGLGDGAWALVDAAGNSQVGFWPLHLGRQQFILVLSGEPRLNQPAFTELVWVLARRYLNDEDYLPDQADAEGNDAAAEPAHGATNAVANQ